MRITARFIIGIGAILLAITSIYTQSRQDFVLANITAKSGEKATGFIEVPAGEPLVNIGELLRKK